MDDEGPKYRLEHAANGRAVCHRAACKRDNVKIVIGELRVGTHTFFEREQRWYMAWRHWGCATPHQIKGLQELTENDPTKAPGYDRLSPESQEQVRLALENNGVVDKEFKGIREDLAKNSAKYGAEIRNADGYKVDVATRAAGCRDPDCLSKGNKVTKGELRLGLSVPFDGEHSSWVFKHWRCTSKFDLEQITALHKDELFDGIDALPMEYQQAVQATLENGEVVDPPKIEPDVKPKKSRAKKRKVKDDESDSNDDDKEVEDTPKPKRSRKKSTIKDQEFSSEEGDPEYVPRKTKSRSAPMKEEAELSTPENQTHATKEEETDPAVQNIEAMAAAMREAAARR